MKTTIDLNNLDFEVIKQELLDYYTASDSPYKDWNFEGSSLNTLLDALAYNTHYNALLAHVSLNETFLQSAQVRKNVVSHAQLLGYIPNSRSAAKAQLDLEYIGSTELTIPRGTEFTSGDDDFTFVTLDDYKLDINERKKRVIEVYEGSIKSISYPVNTNNKRQEFEIPHQNVDIGTLQVNVRDHANVSKDSSSGIISFRRFGTLEELDERSNVYFIREASNGKYYISFGDDTIGFRPKTPNIVDIKYLVTEGEVGNGIRNFDFTDSSLADDIDIVAETRSFNGSEKESTESIRRNSPLFFGAQGRGVTENDIRSLIRNQFNQYNSIRVWGGETHKPDPVYGKVFISVFQKLPDEDEEIFRPLQQAEKNEIVDFLQRRKVATMIPEVMDPNVIKLYFDVSIRYDDTRLRVSEDILQQKVEVAIQNFSNETLSRFDAPFYYSNFLEMLQRVDPAITNVYAIPFLYKTFELNQNQNRQHVFSFTRRLNARLNEFKDSYIRSEPFTFLGSQFRITDVIDPARTNPQLRNIIAFRTVRGVRELLRPSIGNLNTATGEISFTGVAVDSDIPQRIKLFTAADSFDLYPENNDIFVIDNSLTRISIDKERSKNAPRFKR